MAGKAPGDFPKKGGWARIRGRRARQAGPTSAWLEGPNGQGPEEVAGTGATSARPGEDATSSEQALPSQVHAPDDSPRMGAEEEDADRQLTWEDEYAGEAGYEGDYDEAYLQDDETYAYPGGPHLEPAYYTGPAYPGQPPRGRTKPSRPAGPWPRLVLVTAVAVVAAAVALALTAPRSSKRLVGTTGSATTVSANTSISTSAPKPTSTTSAPTSTTLGRTTTTTARRQLAKNLVIGAATKQSLVTTWLATNPGGVGLSAKDVAGTAPGQVYYAYDVSISTYFAVAAFQPSAALMSQARTATGKAKLRQFTNYDYVFSLQTGSTWTLLGLVPKSYCPGEWVPAPVLAVWGLCGFSPRTG